MATALSTVFGNEISVSDQPRLSLRQYSGFAGACGLTTMHMGTRGYPIAVTGRLSAYGETYAAARAALITTIEAVEAYLWAYEDDYTHAGCTYYNVVWDRFQLLPDARGKVYHWTSANYCVADFIMTGKALY